MAEIFQNRDKNIKHVELLIAAHRMRFLDIAALLESTIADEQHRSVWPGLKWQIQSGSSREGETKLIPPPYENGTALLELRDQIPCLSWARGRGRERGSCPTWKWS